MRIWLWSAGLLVGVLACVFALSGLSSAQVSTNALSSLATTTEVGIGICVAYLGLDRFRLHNRVRAMADEFSRLHTAGRALLIASRADGQLNEDEICVLTVYALAGDREIQAYVSAHERVFEDNDFLGSVPGRALNLLLRVRLDRTIVIVLLAPLCAWHILAGVLQVSELWSTALPMVRVLAPVLTLTALAYVVPASCYLISEWAIWRTRAIMRRKFRSIARTMSRTVPGVAPPASTVVIA